jgi:hypothetical protein
MLRILGVELNGIKDVNHGELAFQEAKSFRKGDFRFSRPGIIGIYGQNGSGKTAVIECFRLLKALGQSQPIYQDSLFAFLVSRWLKSSRVVFSFSQENDQGHFLLNYAVTLAWKSLTDPSLYFQGEDFSVSRYDVAKKRFVSYLPPLKVDFANPDIKTALSSAKEFSLDSLFGPLGGKNADALNKAMQIAAQKGVSAKLGVSFLFSDSFLSLLSESSNPSARELRRILSDLKKQISEELFVYSVKDDALGNLGMGELLGVGGDRVTSTSKNGVFLLPNNGPFPVKEEVYPLYVSLAEQINVVLPAFVPNFKLELKDLGPMVFPNGDQGRSVEARSVVNGTAIPLMAESDGIKKIVAVSSAIIHLYNQRDVWVAIDEFDSGVFEYLFGQILSILGTSAKGQLIFTSHNLRPLEVLDHDDIFVSTSNADDRYVKLVNVKATNNVRDFYIRSLQIGGQREKLYNETEESQIALALRKGGHLIDEFNKRTNKVHS